ncbi:MAG: NnrU family protein [Alteromonadaceae bacterium]|nr:NnrU family protein [Alteromonadaceae bacterium]|tara:strand:- start:187 stop:759 length:573 start_codon:yes stop_codon:yes gene_type:complete
MWTLLVGLLIFLGVHSISIANHPLRDRLASGWGLPVFKGVFSLASLVGLILIIWGYGIARQDPVVIYTPPLWLRHIAMLLLLPVFTLVIAAYFPGRISHALKHPLLVAVKLWALAHLLTNGTLADIVLFGGFLAWAVADRISLKKRPARVTPSLPASGANDGIALAGGLVVYLLMVFKLHAWLIGVSPMG